MTYESLSDGGFATGSMLGSGGFIVYDDTYVRNTWNFARFYHHESCNNVHHVVKEQDGRKSIVANRKRSRT
jgi:NADH:ubiquinone oxidoreductase subunit F (NADH-binding)